MRIGAVPVNGYDRKELPMYIDSIEVFHVGIPLRQPQSTPCGRAERLETVVVRMASGSLTGWGEASPGNGPLAGPEWAAGVFACVRDWLAPLVVGRSCDAGKDLQEAMACVRANQFAKAALDTAWWDLKARAAGRPLHQLLGGRSEPLEVGTSFDRMDSPEPFIEAIGRAFASGFSRVELKFRPGWELNMLNFVRHQFPVERLHVDVEGALSLAHMELLCRLDDFSLAMVEQPLPPDDLVGHAMLQETIRTPVCLDEAITTPQQADMALELHSAQYVNLKAGRVGGLTPALAIHDLCHQNCIPCWVGAMPQSALGMRIGMALASKPNCTYPADFPFEPWLADDLVPPLQPTRHPADGKLRIELGSEPGLGVEPDEKLLARFTLAQARLTSSKPASVP